MLEIGPARRADPRAAARRRREGRGNRARRTLPPDLEPNREPQQGRFSALFQDALATDYRAVAAETGVTRVVANLPYNIATPLIVHWLTAGPWLPWYDKIVVMLQKEVAERLVAPPGARLRAARRPGPIPRTAANSFHAASKRVRASAQGRLRAGRDRATAPSA